ncbi:GNAT family N-acetyltransferase [Streptomyces canus]|uniref:GNAT family N-acetyltransferase n=1 Tax=Streptomyces canus TaxID=58343 RepID=UPI0033F5640D
MTIRDAAPSDADDVYRLLSGFVTSYGPDRAVFDDVTFPRIIEIAADGRAEFLVAEQASRVVGYLLALRVPTLFAGGTILELLELTVDAPVRGRGTGSALIRAAQARAREAKDVEVTVPTAGRPISIAVWGSTRPLPISSGPLPDRETLAGPDGRAWMGMLRDPHHSGTNPSTPLHDHEDHDLQLEC